VATFTNKLLREGCSIMSSSTNKQAILQKYCDEQRKLRIEKDALINQRKPINTRLNEISQRLRDIGHAIYDLKGGPNAPSITDHAVVRYLERVEGLDTMEIKAKIRKHKDAVWRQNTIVTFFEDEEKS